MKNKYIEELSNLKLKEDILTYLMNIPYETVIHLEQSHYCLSISHLNLTVKDNNIEKAFASLEDLKRKFFLQSIESESYLDLNFPTNNHKATFKDVFSSLYSLFFEYKRLISFIVVFLLIANSCAHIGKSVDRGIKRAQEKIVENIQNSSPEKIEKRKKRIQSFLIFLKPYHIQYKQYLKEIESEVKNQSKKQR